MRTRAAVAARRVLGSVVPLLCGAISGCNGDFDTSRTIPPRGTLGEELFGVVCDRVGAQSLHEDLTGASYRDVCHRRADGTFADKVDLAQLPPAIAGQPDIDDKPVPLAKQQTDRAYGAARVETLGRHRKPLVAALDAAFPGIQVPVKDVGNADPAKSCGAPSASGTASFHDVMADVLSRMTALYDDGTIPQTTEALGRIMNAFKASPDAQKAWARFDARAGYRPIDIAIGAARPAIAYPSFRDFANALLAVVLTDSGPSPELSKLLEVAHAELLNSTPDAPLATLKIATDPVTGQTILSRPRADLEVLQSIFYAQDAAFGGGTSRWLVRRDARGFASLAASSVAAPFVDSDGDGLPDVDDVGRFVTSDGRAAPSPFFSVDAPDALARDSSGRALDAPGGKPIYGYIDTSRTFTASLLRDLVPLLDADPSHHHETVSDFMAGLNVLLGARKPATKTYADGAAVQYQAFDTASSPLLDLVYAFGQVLADPQADASLALSSTLVSEHPNDLARVVGDGLYAKSVADKHPEAKIPPTSTFWDETIDATIQIAKEPGLLEDVLRALGDDATLGLAGAFGGYMTDLDRISYDRQNLNGPAFDFTTNDGSEPKTPVDRTKADTGANRSEMQRFLAAIHDTNGVTACNKDQAVVHAQGLPLIGSADVCDGGLCGFPTFSAPFAECKVFKIENVAAFYLDSIVGKANLYFRPSILRNGILGVGAANVGVIEESSGIGTGAGNGADLGTVGFWDPSDAHTFRPKPAWLDRLVFFDLAGDSPNSGDLNYKTNHFLRDLQGDHVGTSVCPERIIPDPDPGAPDASSDGLVHGLRDCTDGDWLFQRDQDATFVWEDLGFYRAVTPLVSAFANHGREDLFIALMEVQHRHWQTAQGTQSECKLDGSASCTKDGVDTYEPLLAQIFTSDMLKGLHDLVKIVETIQVPTCDGADAGTHACTKPGIRDGITVLADTTRALVDPDRAKSLGWKDRAGKATSRRNDGTTNPQVTLLYLVLEALSRFDEVLAKDAQRQAQWKSARSQMVDRFLGVAGQNTPNATFSNTAFPKITPVIVSALRAQLFAHCAPPYGACNWARQDLTKNAGDTIGGPTFAAALDLNEAIRKSDGARTALEKLLAYLADAGSSNDALAEMLASTDDLVQVLRDDANLVPLYHLLATAAEATKTGAHGGERRGAVHALLALLSRLAGRSYDAGGAEICANEVDPDGAMNVALAHLVTPMTDSSGSPGETPLEVILDAIADVNRAAPGASDKLVGSDYANMANELGEFLLDDQRGLEQFYAIVRNGTK